ncbi:hypothetical protein HHI36_012773 [Cryptolaemus montrouzieri]|uniref:Uncharacterized protein n=1 Tax=Cryptolaemus montrouzieri TaxID=559131 RepID=A0ABD2NFH1_9CUCU
MFTRSLEVSSERKKEQGPMLSGMHLSQLDLLVSSIVSDTEIQRSREDDSSRLSKQNVKIRIKTENSNGVTSHIKSGNHYSKKISDEEDEVNQNKNMFRCLLKHISSKKAKEGSKRSYKVSEDILNKTMQTTPSMKHQQESSQHKQLVCSETLPPIRKGNHDDEILVRKRRTCKSSGFSRNDIVRRNIRKTKQENKEVNPESNRNLDRIQLNSTEVDYIDRKSEKYLNLRPAIFDVPRKTQPETFSNDQIAFLDELGKLQTNGSKLNHAFEKWKKQKESEFNIPYESKMTHEIPLWLKKCRTTTNTSCLDDGSEICSYEEFVANLREGNLRLKESRKN